MACRIPRLCVAHARKLTPVFVIVHVIHGECMGVAFYGTLIDRTVKGFSMR